MSSDHDIRMLIGQASLVYERLSGSYSAQQLDPFRIERRIETWQHAIATASDIEWQSYLTRNGWGQPQLVTLCCDTSYVAHLDELPSWGRILTDVWDAVVTNDQLSHAQQFVPHASVHALAVVTPFVNWLTSNLSVAHTPDHIYAWVLPRLVTLADDAVRIWAAQRAMRGAIPSRVHALTPLLNDDVWHQFASEHAWLMRMLATTVADLAATITAAVTHLSRDWLALRQHCGMQGATPQICGFADALPIYHQVGGITILLAQQQITYVPQPAPQSDVLAHITTWLNRRGAQIPIKFPARVVHEDAHWIALPPTVDPAHDTMPQIAYALGSLAALCNMCGIAQLTSDAILTTAHDIWVLDASMVAAVDTTSLAHCIVGEQRTPGYAHVWPTSLAPQTTHPRPWLDRYVDDTLAGYQHTSDAVLHRARDIIHALYSQPPFPQRVAFTPSPKGYQLLPSLYDFARVRDGFDASMVLAQILGTVPVQVNSHITERGIIDACGRMRMPHIYQSSDYTSIIARLSEMTRYTQLWHAAQLHLALTPCHDTPDGRAPWLTKQVTTYTSEQLGGEALQLIATIVANQVAMPTGCTWFVLPHDNHARGVEYADAGLINGVSGIALALSALSTLSNDDITIQTAARGFFHAISLLQSQPHQVGGVGYAIALAAPLLKLPHLCDVLWKQVKEMNLPHMYAQPAADAVHGVASTVIAFIALHRVEPLRGWQMLALAAGERLLQLRQRNPQNERIWAGQQLSLGGFGSSGIALALTRLYELTQDFRFLRAVYDIVQHQDRFYDEAHGGWADTRTQPATYPLTWCHGTLGPGMVRLVLQSHDRSGHPSAPLRALLDGIDHAGMHEGDGLCCGMAGSIDFLLSVSREFHQPYYAERASYWVTQMITRAHERGGYVTATGFPGIYDQPALMQGSAGIAYQIARCAYPRLFPSLLWYGLPPINQTS